MAEYQLLRCMVALGGDKDQIIARHRGKPITYPELAILQHLHGDDSVFDIAVVGTCEMSVDDVYQRMRVIYGPEVVEKVYPGARPRMDTGDPNLPPCTRPVYVAPPTQPDRFDPVLKPLTFMPNPNAKVIERAPPPPEASPSDEEIARYVQDDDEGVVLPELENETEPVDLAHALRPAVDPSAPMPSPLRPRVQDQPQTRVSFKGKARQARPTEASLPDVAGARPRTVASGLHDHDRPRG